MYPSRRTSASARPASACYPTQHSPNSYSPQQPEASPTRYPMPYAAHMQPPPPPPPPPAGPQDHQYYYQQPSTSYSHLAPTALAHVLRPPSPRPERPPRPSSSYVQEYPYAGQAHATQAPPLPPKVSYSYDSEPGTTTPRPQQQQLPAYSSADSYAPPTLYPPDKAPIEPSPEDDPESEEAQLARALAASAAEVRNEDEELRKAIEESLALSSANPSPSTDAWEEYDPKAFEPSTASNEIVPRPLDAGYGNGKGKERAPAVPEVILLRADSSSSSSESGWEEYDPRAFDFPRSVTDDLRERLSSASSLSLATTTSSEESRARAEDERRLVDEMRLEEEQLTRERDEQIARDEELSRRLLEAEGLNGAQAPGEGREHWLDRVAQEVEDALRRKLVAAGELVPPSPNGGPPPDEMTLPRYTESPSASAGPLPSLPPTNPFAAQLSPHVFNGPITSPSPASTVVELPTTPTLGVRPLPTQPQPHPLLHHQSEPILPHEQPRPHVLPHSASMPVPQIPGPSKMEREQLRMDALAEEDIGVAGQDVPHLEVGATGVMTHISYGFTTPQMIYRLPPAPPVPDVIAIAPFPSPAFHMQAPSWRALLRALAHMSDTKIEATPRALAKLGGEPARLRAVVQFVKVPLADSPWRTVLYLSLDNSVPPNTQQAWRYTNNDTTRLPYNFPTPQPGASTQPLTNTPEAPLYSFPAPHAELPLSMPGVARFLTEKMNDARAETSSRSTTRRLAKIVDACYPEPREKREPGDRRAALLGRFFGRGGARRGGVENDQTYDLVTPFRMDDWG